MFREKLRIRLMFFEKILRNWPKRPIGIVVWVEGEIQGYGVVSKHSKRVPACGFCAVQVPCPNSQIACWGAGLRWRLQKQHPSGCCFRAAEKPVIASQSADWRGNPFPKRPISALICRFAAKRLRIPTSLRAAKQVPLGYRLARQSVPFSTGIRIPTPVTRSLARNDSASRCRDVADAVPYEGISGRSVGRPALRPLSFTGGAIASPAPCILPPDMLQWHQF